MLTISLQAPEQLARVETELGPKKPGEALVRVHRIGICGTDYHAFAGRQPFFNYPRILGHELGVEVIDPGDDPNGLKVGDRCSVEPYLNCGHCIACRRGKYNCCTQLQVLGVHRDGGMRTFFSLPAKKLHRSSQLDFEQLALVETLAIGAHAVERAELNAEDSVLVIGAGPIGLSVLQFARTETPRISVMDTQDSRLSFCREHFGITETIDAKLADLAPEIARANGGEMPTVVFDATGNQASMNGAFSYPAAGGKLIFVGLVQGELTFNDPSFHRRELTILGSRNALPATFTYIIRRIESGEIDTRPWITHRLGLEEVPKRLPLLAREPGLVKAMITVPTD